MGELKTVWFVTTGFAGEQTARIGDVEIHRHPTPEGRGFDVYVTEQFNRVYCEDGPGCPGGHEMIDCPHEETRAHARGCKLTNGCPFTSKATQKILVRSVRGKLDGHDERRVLHELLISIKHGNEAFGWTSEQTNILEHMAIANWEAPEEYEDSGTRRHPMEYETTLLPSTIPSGYGHQK